MTPTDRAAFVEILTHVAELFAFRLTPMAVELYFRALEDLPLDAVRAGFGRACASEEFMPKPVTVRTLVEGSVEDRATHAWQALRDALRAVGRYQSLEVEDAAAAVALERVYAGWIGFGAADELEAGMQEARRKEFLATYRHAAQTRATPGTREFPGLHARENALTAGSWTRGQLPPARRACLLTTGVVSWVDAPAALPAAPAGLTPAPVDLVAELRRRLSAGTSPAPTPTEEDA